VNIGDRQRGRLKAESVIDCAPEHAAITAALQKVYTAKFQAMLPAVKNPYGEGGASEKIVKILRDIPLDGLLKKSFYDINPV
jgi:GDP/UDP-N,N'-diacetylbacillosamine 2-epimerase (hydrolysing)